MLDVDIRRVFFDWLESTVSPIRIMEEHVVGKARCDFFAVTDRLTGYEIKSDADSYFRLAGQVKYYDKYFDENCVVVGRSHAKHVAEHVPEYWGIYCVEGSSVELLRAPKPNPKLNREARLSLLWREELGMLLNMFKLPRYLEQSKKFIRRRIIARVPEEKILPAVCEVLFERDYSIFE